MKSPSDLDELKALLIQTTWIPFATGRGLAHSGHVDGGFSAWRHPTCRERIEIDSFEVDIYLNMLNPNFGEDTATKFWNLGFEQGL